MKSSKKIHHLLWLIAISTIANFGCQKEIFIEAEERESRLAISSVVTDSDNQLKVVVSSSQPTSSSSNTQFVENAQVRMFLEGELLDTFDYWDTGSYVYWHLGRIKSYGKTFQLAVDAPGFPSVRAEAIMPFAPMIDGGELEIFGGKDDQNRPFDFIRFDLTDRPNEVNYYEISFYFRNEFGNYFKIYTWTDETSPEEGFENVFLLSDETFDGQKKRLDFKLSTEFYDPEKDAIVIKVTAINKIKYDYSLLLKRNELSQYNPLSEPIIYPTNIESGAGFFSLEAVSNIEIE